MELRDFGSGDQLRDEDRTDICTALDLLLGWCRPLPLQDRVDAAVDFLNRVLERNLP